MLRKKLKLSDNPEEDLCTANRPLEFSLSTFINAPKPKLSLIVPSAHTLASITPHLTIAEHETPPADANQLEIIPIWKRVYQLEVQLCEALKQVPLSSEVAATYNPIEYAAGLHLAYMQKFLNDSHKPVVFLGMNPGPWGMCQTGVPFGYVPAVRDWMQLQGPVLKPIGELAVRPVEGLSCSRGEQSGQRWWGLYQEICGEPESFFRNCFVFNICPLAFFHSSGRNITPAELKGTAKTQMQEICTVYLKKALDLFAPKIIVSVGRYCEDRVKLLVRQNLLDPNNIRLLCMPHPSPRSLNNTNWSEKAQKWLVDNGVMPYLKA